MKLRDYGYQTKKNDVLRTRAMKSAFSEKGANWVNKQLRDMLRVAREQESIILFKDMCNFVGSSTDREINNTMKDYDEVFNNSTDHTTFLDNAVFKIGWRNVHNRLCDAWKVNDLKTAKTIKKDMDYIIETHSHRKKVIQDMAWIKEAARRLQDEITNEDYSEDSENEGEEKSDEYKDLGDEEHGYEDESISLRDYGYSVRKTQRSRLGALRKAIESEDRELVYARLERLGQYHHVMIEDLEALMLEEPNSSDDTHHDDCKCVSADEIRTIVREELSKVFGDIKKMNEDIQKMYSEMIA